MEVQTWQRAKLVKRAGALSPKMSSITTATYPHITCINYSPPVTLHTRCGIGIGKFHTLLVELLSAFTPSLQSSEVVSHKQHNTMTEVQTPVAPDQQLEETGKAQYSFNFSDFLRREYRFGLDPNRPSCKAYMQGHCPLGARCPDKHHVSSSYNKCVLSVLNPRT